MTLVTLTVFKISWSVYLIQQTGVLLMQSR